LIVLEENILDGQRLLLEAWRIAVRQIGMDIGHKGLKDEEIIVLLRRRRNATFFTRDAGFYLPIHRNRSCCLVVAGVGQYEVATFIGAFCASRNMIANRSVWAGWSGFRTPAWLPGARGRKQCFRQPGAGPDRSFGACAARSFPPSRMPHNEGSP